ncbi:MAG: NADH:flavin oxidoreductase [Candidatus Riflebacteria bacterium]|nr:NADH:flavin oxidoreductase [Candidatus Riflebacteria bacterium]
MPPTPFESLTIRGVTLKNRFVAAPMATQYADRRGHVNDTMVSYYTHLALTGVALVVVEGALISPEGPGWSRELEVFTPAAVPGLSQLAETIRERGAIPFLQLHHAGRQGLPSRDHSQMVAPSAIPCPILDRPVRALTVPEIQDLVLKFTEAARLARLAGFAGVELHGAHGYLLHQFVSPLTNRRDDEYGLQRNAASRFPLEVVQAIRSAFPDLLISYRMSARDYLPRGLNLPVSCLLAQALEGAGADLISVSGGMYASLHGPESVVGPATPYGVFRDDARDIREAVSIPVAVVGKIQSPALAHEIIANQDAHLVVLGRPLLRDPQWVQKARGLDREPVRACLLCQRCRFHGRGCPDGASLPTWIS